MNSPRKATKEQTKHLIQARVGQIKSIGTPKEVNLFLRNCGTLLTPDQKTALVRSSTNQYQVERSKFKKSLVRKSETIECKFLNKNDKQEIVNSVMNSLEKGGRVHKIKNFNKNVEILKLSGRISDIDRWKKNPTDRLIVNLKTVGRLTFAPLLLIQGTLSDLGKKKADREEQSIVVDLAIGALATPIMIPTMILFSPVTITTAVVDAMVGSVIERREKSS